MPENNSRNEDDLFSMKKSTALALLVAVVIPVGLASMYWLVDVQVAASTTIKNQRKDIDKNASRLAAIETDQKMQQQALTTLLERSRWIMEKLGSKPSDL